METALILKIIEILLKDGVPALVQIFAGLNNDNPSLEDIKTLHAKVKPLSEADFSK